MRVDFEGIEQCIPANTAGTIDLDGFTIHADASEEVQPCVTGGVFRGDTEFSGPPNYNLFVFDAPIESFLLEIGYIESDMSVCWDNGSQCFSWDEHYNEEEPFFFSGSASGSNGFDTLSFNSFRSWYEIDAVEWTWAVVPEPGTGLLLGLGLVWAAAVARWWRR